MRTCYETPWLGDPARLTLEDIAAMFRATATVLEVAPPERRRITFYWQGGEPFMLPIPYWRAILDLERQILGPGGAVVRNEIQSNGTLIRAEHLPVLKDYLLGLSFDVANDLRVTAAGGSTTRSVIDVLDWLLAEGVTLSGCIAVVSRQNIDRPLEVADFFLSRRLDFRLLNIYTATDALLQVRRQAVEWERYLKFCEALLTDGRVLEALGSGVSIEPLTTALDMLEGHQSGERDAIEADGSREWVLVVNTNGDLYSAGDLYNPEFRYGNICRDEVAIWLDSAGRRRRIARGQQRIESTCKRCFLFGRGCDGTYVANCTPEEARAFEAMGTCYYGWLAAAAQRHGIEQHTTPCTSA